MEHSNNLFCGGNVLCSTNSATTGQPKICLRAEMISRSMQEIGKYFVFCRNFAKFAPKFAPTLTPPFAALTAPYMTKHTIRTAILDYADSHSTFSAGELFLHVTTLADIDPKTLSWYLSNLVQHNQLSRIGRGEYAKASKPIFTPAPTVKAKRIYKLLHAQFPLVDFCVYDGEIIEPLLHHLACNRVVYVEAPRDTVETVFFFLKERHTNVYLLPDKQQIYHYIDLSKPQIFVKHLTSESPLQQTDGVPSPTLEKLLVDIQRDDDFFYLQGAESDYIIENAFDLYAIHQDRLLRYAARRNLKKEMVHFLKNNIHDTPHVLQHRMD